MARGDPTPAQMKNLQYVDPGKPAFIQRMLAGGSSSNDNNGRPPIPERPADDPHSDSDDDPLRAMGDEAPQVVVLKEGKHLSRDEARAADRKARGLPEERPPTPPAAESTATAADDDPAATTSTKSDQVGITFGKAKAKRKAVGIGADSDDDDAYKAPKSEPLKKKKAKAKGGVKLSFA